MYAAARTASNGLRCNTPFIGPWSKYTSDSFILFERLFVLGNQWRWNYSRQVISLQAFASAIRRNSTWIPLPHLCVYYIYIYVCIHIRTKSANNAAYWQVAGELPFAGNGLQVLKTCAWSCTATKIAGAECVVEMHCYNKCCYVLKASWLILLHNDSGITQSLSANCGR